MRRQLVPQLTLVALILTLVASAGQQDDPKLRERVQEGPVLVSVVQLICNPEKYDGKEIMTVGFLNLTHEGDVLYLSQEDYKHSIVENGVRIRRNAKLIQDKSDLNQKYVALVGVFHAESPRWGHGTFTVAGRIDQITRAVPWSDPANPRALKR